MTMIELPHYVLRILDTLKKAGHRGCAVGGCVRDALMGNAPSDYDIATDAPPERVRSLFAQTIPTGERFGTITVLIDKKSVEVTTFRTESGYDDNRRPAMVAYGASLKDDLARRDFTINAMAYSPDHGLIDPYGGREDILLRTVRCVGEPDKRFTEDALRILRGIRFCASLGFEAESATMLAMIGNAPLLKNISGERIRDEISRVIMTKHPEELNIVLMAGGLSHLFLGASQDLARISRLPQIFEERMAAFLLLCSGSLGRSAQLLRLSKREQRFIGAVFDLVNKQMIADRVHLKRLLAAHEADELLSAVRVKGALYDEENTLDCVEEIRHIQNSGEPYRIAHLAVNGVDIQALDIVPPHKTGQVLRFLLNCCIGSPQLNEKETLIALAKSYSE